MMSMYKLTTVWLRIVGVLLMVFVGSAGALQVAAQSHFGMSHGGTPTPVGCQSTCNPVTSTVSTLAKRDEEDQDEATAYDQPLYPILDLFGFVHIRKFISVSEWFRLLRPPDIFALNSIYRF